MLTLTIKADRYSAALLTAERGIPFAFFDEIRGSEVRTVGYSPLSYLPTVALWAREGGPVEYALHADSILSRTDRKQPNNGTRDA